MKKTGLYMAGTDNAFFILINYLE